jgi:radical SAM superfamily enzyme YgiQ (UPF0313 family)
MRILFVSTNRLRVVMPPMPLGLASVIAQIDDSRHELRVLDLMFEERPEAALTMQLSTFEPDLIAISIRNIDNQSFFHTEYLLPQDKELVERCREVSGATLVVGGPAFTVSPLAIFDYLGADFGIIGEGEIAFRELVARIESGNDWRDIPGLVWRSAEGVTVNPPERPEDLDSLRMPRRELFDGQRYAAEGGAATIVIKQGCPFNCLYCDSPHTMGKHWRMKSPGKVADELVAMQALGVKVSFFADAIFNCPADHAREVCREMIRRRLDMHWIAMVHPAFLDRELIELMRDAGCVAVSLGCDSCSERMLKVLRKGFTKEQLRVTAEMLEEAGVNYILSLLIGAPGEDRETVEESIEFLSRRSPMMVDFCVGIRLMPHTELVEIAVREGVISAGDPLMEPRFYISPQIEDWIEGYLQQVCAANKSYLFHGLTDLASGQKPASG